MTNMKKIKDVQKSILTKISGSVNMGSTIIEEYDPNKVYNEGDRIYYPKAVEDGLSNTPYFKAKEDGITGPFDINKWEENTIDQELGQVHFEQNRSRTALIAATSNSGILTPFKGSEYRDDEMKVWTKGFYGSKGRKDSMSTLNVSSFEALVAGIHVHIKGNIPLNIPNQPHFQQSSVVNDRVMELPYFTALEVWLEEMDKDEVSFSTDRSLIKYRFRTFKQNKLFKRDGITTEGSDINQYNPEVTAQGANDTPVDGNEVLSRFFSNEQRKNPQLHGGNGILKNDSGVYIAGDGSVESKRVLGTMDGYVYMIPLFFVGTRYSTTNTSIDEDSYYDRTVFSPKITPLTLKNAGTFYNGELITVIGDKIDDVDDLVSRDLSGENVEYPLYLVNNPQVKLNENISAVLLSITEVSGRMEYTLRINGDRNKKVTLAVGHIFNGVSIPSTSPDGEYAGMVTHTDVVELFHVIDNNGMDFLLADSFNRLLRGELDTNNKYELTRQQLGLKPAHNALPSVRPKRSNGYNYLVNLMHLSSNDISLFEAQDDNTDITLVNGRIQVSRKNSDNLDCNLTMRTSLLPNDTAIDKVSALVKSIGLANVSITLQHNDLTGPGITKKGGEDLLLDIDNPEIDSTRGGIFIKFNIKIKGLDVGQKIYLYDTYIVSHKETQLPKLSNLGITPRNIVSNLYPYTGGLNDNDDGMTNVNWEYVSSGNGSQSLAIKEDGSLWAWGWNSAGQLGLGDTIDRLEPTQVGTDKTWKHVSSGNGHTVAIKKDGSLWAWGNNGVGQLGLGDSGDGTHRNTPVQVGTDTTWKYISSRDTYSLAIKEDGSLWAWGNNSNGQLGLGDNTNRNIPTQVGTDKTWKHVSSGSSAYTVAIKEDGSLWAWGLNNYGQLGLGDNTNRNTPAQVGTDKTWKHIDCNGAHSLAIKEDGSLWSWGNNIAGQLGLGDTIDRLEPTQVGTEKTWRQAFNGANHTLAIKKDGSLWAWGHNGRGQLGLGDTIQRNTPVQIGTERTWKHVSSGNDHTLAIKEDGSLWAWGLNVRGQLGLGDTIQRNSPSKIGSDDGIIITDNTWKQISSCGHRTLAIKEDGSLWAWGNNSNGLLGIGSSVDSYIPTQVGTDKTWKHIVCGYHHTLAIKEDDSLWSWGLNNTGQLGLGNSGDGTHRNTPVQVGTEKTWKHISGGVNHSMAIKEDGSLWAWGYNVYGQLGLGDTTGRNTPTQVGTDKTWKHIVCGYHHTLAIKEDDSLWSWGLNNTGQLGLGNSGDGTHRNTPVQVGTEKTWKHISGGVNHSMAIKEDGSLWAWGNNGVGQLGLGNSGDGTHRNTPVQIGTERTWKHVSSGNDHTLAIKEDGSLWAWGYNVYGQLGLGNNTNRNIPTQVGTDKTWKHIVCGYHHTLAIKEDDSLWSWGLNNTGQLGLGDTIQRNSPTQILYETPSIPEVPEIDDLPKQIACANHTLAIKEDGSLWAWGLNNYGQLGLGDNTNRNIPTQVGVDKTWKHVICGTNHSLAIKEDGSLWAWGNNGVGQLGLGNSGDGTHRNTPVQVGTEKTWKHISGGVNHSMAIKEDGSLWAWGYNVYGQLGLGNNTNRNIPTQVGVDKTWKHVICGTNHTLAIKEDDSLWAWGDSSSGQLGLGDNTNRNIPTQVGVDKTWKHVICGTNHTLAIKEDDSLWAWGLNNYGQLGQGDTTGRNTPTQVGVDKTWKHVICGTNHTLAIKEDGSLWAWGYNNQGQLGLGDNTNRNIPTQVGVDKTWKHVICGTNHTLAIKEDGSLWAWGYNGEGQLGLGDNTQRSTPAELMIIRIKSWGYNSRLGLNTITIIGTPKTISIDRNRNKPYIDGSFTLQFSEADQHEFPSAYVIIDTDVNVLDTIHTNFLEYKDELSVEYAQISQDRQTVDGILHKLDSPYIRLKENVKELHLFIRSKDDLKPLNEELIPELFFATDPVKVPYGSWYVPYQYFLANAPEVTSSADKYYNTAEITGTITDSFTPFTSKQLNGGIVYVQSGGRWTEGDTITIPFGDKILTNPSLVNPNIEGTWVTNYSEKVLVFMVDNVIGQETEDIIVNYSYLIEAGKGLDHNPRKVHAVDIDGLPYIQSDKVTVTTGFWEPNTHLADFFTSETEITPYTWQELLLIADPEKKSVKKEYSAVNGVVKTRFTFDIVKALKHQFNMTDYEVQNTITNLKTINDLFRVRIMGTTSNGFNNKAIIRSGAFTNQLTSMNNSETLITIPGNNIDTYGRFEVTVESDRLDGSKPGFIEIDFVEVTLVYPNETPRKTDLMFVPQESRTIKNITESAFAMNMNIIPGFFHWTPESLGTNGFLRDDKLVFGVNSAGTTVRVDSPLCYVRDNTPYVFTVDPSSIDESESGIFPTLTIQHLDRGGVVLRTDTHTISTVDDTVFRFTTPKNTNKLKVSLSVDVEITTKVTVLRPMISVDNVSIPDYTPVYRLGSPENMNADDNFIYRTPTKETLSSVKIQSASLHVVDGKYVIEGIEQLGGLDVTKVLVEDGNVLYKSVDTVGKRAAYIIEYNLRKLINFENIRKLVDIGNPNSPFELDLSLPVGDAQNVSVVTDQFLLTTINDMSTETIASQIESKGIVKFILFGDNAVTDSPSILSIDKAVFNIEFDDDTQYVSKNIIYVDKETREVSSEYSMKDRVLNEHSVIDVWYDHLPIAMVEDVTEVTILQEANEVLVTDLGLNNLLPFRNHQYKNPLQYLGMNVEYMHGDLGFVNVPLAADSKDINIGSIIKINKNGVAEGFHNQVTVPVIKKPMVGIFRYLVNHNGEIKLLVVSSKSTDGNIMLYSPLSTSIRLYSLPGRPVSDYIGTHRPTVRENTSLMTPTGVVQGYLDDDGMEIAVYA